MSDYSEGEFNAQMNYLRGLIAEETKIVDRVWAALGITNYETAGGLTIDQIVARYKAALESIAANACCDKCQEAALVARSALNLRASS